MFKLHRHTIPNTAFLILFPGNFLYHTLVNAEVIAPVLGRYLGLVTTSLAIPLLASYGVFIRGDQQRVLRYDYAFAAFTSYLVLITALNFSLGAQPLIVFSHLASVNYFIVFYLLFRSLNFTTKRFQVINSFSFLLMSGTVISLTQNGVFLLILNHATKEHASYQFIAVIFILTAVLILSLQSSITKRIFIYLLTAIVLFLNGARTEFFSFCLLAMVLESLKIRHKRVLTVALLASFSGVYLIIQSIKHLLPDNRVIRLILASHGDGSARSRALLNQNAWTTILDNPFLGDYGNYEQGGYAHNLLSIWVDFGFFGLLFYLCLLFFATISIIRSASATETFRHYRDVSICLIIVCWFSLALAKSFDYLLVPAALGMFANYSNRIQRPR